METKGFAARATRQRAWRDSYSGNDVRRGCARRRRQSRDDVGIREGGHGGSPREGLLFDKEATTFFYNCVFNLMDSLMRFVVLFPRGEGVSGQRSEREDAEKGERERERKREREREISRARLCARACERV